MSDSLDGYPTPYLKCRTFGHIWDEFIPVGKRKPEFGFRFSLLCITCGSERHDLLDTNGAVAARQYVYPDGYYLGFRLVRADARVIYNQRKRRIGRRGNLEVVR